jgi:GntR family transcriptional regulator, rspAB operon transcriptional repressor
MRDKTIRGTRDKSGRSPGSLSDHAYAWIRDKILRGQFELGTALSRRKVAVQLGMSPLPISEAFRRLESEGLLESRPRVGTRVRIPTSQEVRDHYILREALESQSARLFAEKASPQERLELQRMAARLDTMIKRCTKGNGNAKDDFRIQAYHVAFHMRIAECGGSLVLRDAIEKNGVLIFNWLYDTATKSHTPPPSHEDLIKVIAGRDPEAADAAMRRHVRYRLQETQEAITSRFGLSIEGATSGREFPAQTL